MLILVFGSFTRGAFHIVGASMILLVLVMQLPAHRYHYYCTISTAFTLSDHMMTMKSDWEKKPEHTPNAFARRIVFFLLILGMHHSFVVYIRHTHSDREREDEKKVHSLGVLVVIRNVCIRNVLRLII